MKKAISTACALGVVMLGLAVAKAHQPARAAARAWQPGDSQILTAPRGGVVTAVLVRQGDAVVKGQLIVQLHLGELDDRLTKAKAALERTPPELVDSAAWFLGRIPGQMWRRLIATDAGLLAAEQEYAEAVAAAELNPGPSEKERLKRASAHRVEEQQRVGRLTPGSLGQLAASYRERADDVTWLTRQRSAADVRAPSNGVVEIFDLHPGDTVPPAGRVALVSATTR
jgi:biotin carboxyl carrier protein